MLSLSWDLNFKVGIQDSLFFFEGGIQDSNLNPRKMAGIQDSNLVFKGPSMGAGGLVNWWRIKVCGHLQSAFRWQS